MERVKKAPSWGAVGTALAAAHQSPPQALSPTLCAAQGAEAEALMHQTELYLSGHHPSPRVKRLSVPPTMRLVDDGYGSVPSGADGSAACPKRRRLSKGSGSERGRARRAAEQPQSQSQSQPSTRRHGAEWIREPQPEQQPRPRNDREEELEPRRAHTPPRSPTHLHDEGTVAWKIKAAAAHDDTVRRAAARAASRAATKDKDPWRCGRAESRARADTAIAMMRSASARHTPSPGRRGARRRRRTPQRRRGAEERRRPASLSSSSSSSRRSYSVDDLNSSFWSSEGERDDLNEEVEAPAVRTRSRSHSRDRARPQGRGSQVVVTAAGGAHVEVVRPRDCNDKARSRKTRRPAPPRASWHGAAAAEVKVTSVRPPKDAQVPPAPQCPPSPPRFDDPVFVHASPCRRGIQTPVPAPPTATDAWGAPVLAGFAPPAGVPPANVPPTNVPPANVPAGVPPAVVADAGAARGPFPPLFTATPQLLPQHPPRKASPETSTTSSSTTANSSSSSSSSAAPPKAAPPPPPPGVGLAGARYVDAFDPEALVPVAPAGLARTQAHLYGPGPEVLLPTGIAVELKAKGKATGHRAEGEPVPGGCLEGVQLVPVATPKPLVESSCASTAAAAPAAQDDANDGVVGAGDVSGAVSLPSFCGRDPEVLVPVALGPAAPLVDAAADGGSARRWGSAGPETLVPTDSAVQLRGAPAAATPSKLPPRSPAPQLRRREAPLTPTIEHATPAGAAAAEPTLQLLPVHKEPAPPTPPVCVDGYGRHESRSAPLDPSILQLLGRVPCAEAGQEVEARAKAKAPPHDDVTAPPPPPQLASSSRRSSESSFARVVRSGEGRSARLPPPQQPPPRHGSFRSLASAGAPWGDDDGDDSADPEPRRHTPAPSPSLPPKRPRRRTSDARQDPPPAEPRHAPDDHPTPRTRLADADAQTTDEPVGRTREGRVPKRTLSGVAQPDRACLPLGGPLPRGAGTQTAAYHDKSTPPLAPSLGVQSVETTTDLLPPQQATEGTQTAAAVVTRGTTPLAPSLGVRSVDTATADLACIFGGVPHMQGTAAPRREGTRTPAVASKGTTPLAPSLGVRSVDTTTDDLFRGAQTQGPAVPRQEGTRAVASTATAPLGPPVGVQSVDTTTADPERATEATAPPHSEGTQTALHGGRRTPRRVDVQPQPQPQPRQGPRTLGHYPGYARGTCSRPNPGYDSGCVHQHRPPRGAGREVRRRSVTAPPRPQRQLSPHTVTKPPPKQPCSRYWRAVERTHSAPGSVQRARLQAYPLRSSSVHAPSPAPSHMSLGLGAPASSVGSLAPPRLGHEVGSTERGSVPPSPSPPIRSRGSTPCVSAQQAPPVDAVEWVLLAPKPSRRAAAAQRTTSAPGVATYASLHMARAASSQRRSSSGPPTPDGHRAPAPKPNATSAKALELATADDIARCSAIAAELPRIAAYVNPETLDGDARGGGGESDSDVSPRTMRRLSDFMRRKMT
eukprot:TRINITY_DN1751_c0_g2_i1.p1 TRINITY_DN1751_c0_g2~~TRINITY_DN1751_c0_g2_i1.p1  ORF type:complete len:1606 (+),score=200.05 TRINITY_DN1751_c0_g2_i1:391-4818(+)